ncbi:NAD(+) synthase [Candidatus Viridilinea mediisalina]|uniref:Glutamine-dependent NAD(+) synthetase n=1 Tax=Candidatus Viridilinea mediisalina TaxID=2024553 RepID=A0A2A6REQ6_9CHLR|nr:NAD(+) synthase [Candidatus Viridilinea mediisalina]PDW01195.1 NAD(+) synthase [Candidatus Viridilinea mediisalina]
MSIPFRSIYRHGFVRVAVALPAVRVANPSFNATHTLNLAHQAHTEGAALVLFPELGLAAYSNEDLFHQAALLDATTTALATVVAASAELRPLLLVGAPLQLEGRLFNCAVAIHGGRILGVSPKSYLPSYREFYEKRHFAAARDLLAREVELLGHRVPCGPDLLYEAVGIPGLTVHAEICEDLWTPIPPSTYAALAGATLLCNLSASNITIGKADYRHMLCAAQSGRCVAAYLYSAAGPGESTTDLAWDGHALIYENGELLAESQRFADGEQLIMADIDLERLLQDRMRLTSFTDSASDQRATLERLRRIPFACTPPPGELPLRRVVERFPYVPDNPATRDARCYEAYNIQVHGLMQRLRATGIAKLVIGVSGGLDSTQALIVAAKTMDRLTLPRSNILAYTMPGFATSEHTRQNAHALMSALGVSAHELDIRPSALQMLKDLEHPYASGQPVYDITFENVQAGERTSHLFRLANLHHALVLGTGDLSELALGWATYGVGDQMSHYNVNASVPKTLIQHLIRWVVATNQFDAETNSILQSIVDTEISPELIPAEVGEAAQPAQSTEATIGPYALQDFNLYYLTRYGFRPSKVAFLSEHAWSDASQGNWPTGIPTNQRVAYDRATIRHWLAVFLFRFFQTSQFKRSAMPNGPKVGSGGSLSPRGDWRAPSDAAAQVWLAELGLVEEE